MFNNINTFIKKIYYENIFDAILNKNLEIKNPNEYFKIELSKYIENNINSFNKNDFINLINKIDGKYLNLENLNYKKIFNFVVDYVIDAHQYLLKNEKCDKFLLKVFNDYNSDFSDKKNSFLENILYKNNKMYWFLIEKNYSNDLKEDILNLLDNSFENYNNILKENTFNDNISLKNIESINFTMEKVKEYKCIEESKQSSIDNLDFNKY